MSDEVRFLAISERVADGFLAHLEMGRAPAWDFVDDGPDGPRDASGGVIAAGELIDLGTLERRARS